MSAEQIIEACKAAELIEGDGNEATITLKFTGAKARLVEQYLNQLFEEQNGAA